MSINLDERYPGRANGKTLSYPQGSFKNRTSPTSKDGTYLEQDWANDQLAFFQSLMKDAGMTANGLVDTAEASQYFDALMAIVDESTPDASATVRGLIEIATVTEAKALTDKLRAVTPETLGAALNDNVLGMGQTWQNMTASRSRGTTYTNTSGRPIMVIVTIISNAVQEHAARQAFFIDGVSVIWSGGFDGGPTNTGVYSSVTVIVPDGSTYRGEWLYGDLNAWMELR